MDPAFRVAIQARRFALVADDPRYLSWDRSKRAKAVASNRELDSFDALLIGGASESDRICASAVRLLRRSDPTINRIVLDLLATLPGEYLASVYYAIPRERQFALRKALYDLGRHDCLPSGTQEVEAARRFLDELTGDRPSYLDELDPEEAEEFDAFTDKLLARQFGLPAELTDEEKGLAEAGRMADDDFARRWLRNRSSALCASSASRRGMRRPTEREPMRTAPNAHIRTSKRSRGGPSGPSPLLMWTGEDVEARADRLGILLSVSPWAADRDAAMEHLSDEECMALDDLDAEDLALANACLEVQTGIRARAFAAAEELAAAIAEVPEPTTIGDRVLALPDADFPRAARLVLTLGWID